MSIKQYKPKIIQLILGLSITIPIFFNTPITVKASEADTSIGEVMGSVVEEAVATTNSSGGNEDGNGGGESDHTDLGTHNNEGYPSHGKTGWLVYLVSSSGALSSDVVFVSSNGNTPDSNYNNAALKSRIGNQFPVSLNTNAEWGEPFTDSGTGRGGIIKDELINSRSYNGEALNCDYVVQKYLGDEALDLFVEDSQNYYLILETVAWHKVFTGSAAGTYAVASSSGWAKIQSLTGIVPEGDGHTGWCDNKRLQISCHLIANWDGLPSVPSKLGRVTYNEVLSEGYGLIAIRRKDEGLIHTYWQPHGSPGNPEPAPPNKIGKYNIVKGYYEENLTTGEKISLGVYETEGCIPSISIDGEPEFELVDWRTSTTHTLGVDPTNWNPPSSHIQQGTTPKVIQLKAPEKTVYVLLRRVTEEEQEEQEYNYIIKQSQISKRIKISKSDNLPLDEKIGIYDFRWFIPAHQVECITHTYNDECHSEKNQDQATILIV